MKSILVFWVLGLMVIAAGCSTISVQYDYDREVDFAGLKTFDWLHVPDKADINPFTIKRIQSSVTSQLETRGYTMNPGNPDFLIAMHIGQEQKIQVVDWGYSYGPPGTYRGGYRGPNRVDVYQYEEGTLVLDFVEGKSKELIWRGTATGEVDRYASPEQQDKRIHEAVQKILKNFPPPKPEKDTKSEEYGGTY